MASAASACARSPAEPAFAHGARSPFRRRHRIAHVARRRGIQRLYDVTSAGGGRAAEPAERLVALGQGVRGHGRARLRPIARSCSEPTSSTTTIRTSSRSACGRTWCSSRPFNAVCQAERLDVDVDEAAKLCWAAMQGCWCCTPRWSTWTCSLVATPYPRDTRRGVSPNSCSTASGQHPRPPTKR